MVSELIDLYVLFNFIETMIIIIIKALCFCVYIQSTVTVLTEVDPQDLSKEDQPLEMKVQKDRSIDQLKSIQQENQWLRNRLSELEGESETVRIENNLLKIDTEVQVLN